MTRITDFIERLDKCPTGQKGWREFEDICVEIVEFLPMGRLAIMVCSKLPNDGAHIKRNNIYSQRRKVILFMTKEHLKEMLFIKERGEDPCDLIVDLVERFYLQHE